MKMVIESNACECGKNEGITTIVEIDDNGACEVTTVCNACQHEVDNEVNDAE